jgi:hypothetical protein
MNSSAGVGALMTCCCLYGCHVHDQVATLLSVLQLLKEATYVSACHPMLNQQFTCNSGKHCEMHVHGEHDSRAHFIVA